MIFKIKSVQFSIESIPKIKNPCFWPFQESCEKIISNEGVYGQRDQLVYRLEATNPSSQNEMMKYSEQTLSVVVLQWKSNLMLCNKLHFC